MKKLFYTTSFIIAFLGMLDNTQAQAKRGDNTVSTPNAFVLNEQNHKYYWMENYNSEAFEMSVYNKWGELVFNTKDKSQGWDSKSNGQQLAADIYVYAVKIFRDGKWINYTGSIKLIG